VDGIADAVISVRGLRKSYGAVQAVAGIDLEVRRGEIFAFLGPNGAGKTTTVEILEGFRRRSEGDRELERLMPRGVCGWKGAARMVGNAPSEAQHDRDRDEHLPEGPLARGHAPSREGCRRDQAGCEQPAADARPELGPVQRLAAQHRRDRERERRAGRRRKPAGEEQVQSPPIDGEAETREEGDARRGERHGRIEHEPDLRQLVRVAERRVGDEQRQRRAE